MGSVCLALAGVRTRVGTLRRGIMLLRRGYTTKVSDPLPLPRAWGGIWDCGKPLATTPTPTLPAGTGTGRDPAPEVAPAPFPAPSCPRQWGRKQVLGA